MHYISKSKKPDKNKHIFNNNKTVNIMCKDTLEFMEQFQEDQIQQKNDIYDKKVYNAPWVEQFRPESLDNIMSHKKEIHALKAFIQNKQLPHLILSGPPGTGKTSTIIACAKQIYGNNLPLMKLEINASEQRGIEVIRSKVKTFISSKGIFNENTDSCSYKLVILDEADSMTDDAQKLLSNIIDTFTLNVRFCLICNYIDKINSSLLSKCVHFKFPAILKKDVVKKIQQVIKDKHVQFTLEGVECLVKISKGDLRKAINMLQSINMAYGIIDEHSVTTCLGYPTSKNISIIYDYLTNKSYEKAYEKIISIKNTNHYSLTDIIFEISQKLICNLIEDDNNIKIQNYILKLQNIEVNLSVCPTESIQLIGFISIFYI
jgi:replication factor C subunit 3/5